MIVAWRTRRPVARSKKGVSRKKRKRTYQPWLELLESRLTPSNFTVNTLLDTVAVNLITGQHSAGNVSLRSAIQAANSTLGSDTIVLAAGTYTLTRAGAGEDAAATGDLDILHDLTIQGAGAAVTI